MSREDFDISEEDLTKALACSSFPKVLSELVELSRNHFGWFSRHPPRVFEYPWVFASMSDVFDRRVLDIGTGISPLPLLLAKHGARVVTVDKSPVIRELGRGQTNWDGWGYLDYNRLDKNISSINDDILSMPFASYSFDCIYSVSVIEHMPASVRRRLWSDVGRWLVRGGVLLLTVDIFPGTDELWNYNQGELVEPTLEHGDLATLKVELSRVGFELVQQRLLRDLADSRTDCALLHFVRKSNRDQGAVPPEYSRITLSTDKPASNPEVTSGFAARRVLVGCVAENRPEFLAQALRLLQSIRWFGGGMAGVDFVVCVVDDVDSGYAHEFERLGATVKVVSRFSSRHPHSNKLRLLELSEVNAYDLVMLLDCDTVVVNDPMSFLDERVFQAKIADVRTLSHDTFCRLFQHFGLELPGQDYRCNPGGEPTILYCNSGVLVFPQHILSPLGASWCHYNSALLDRLDLLKPHVVHCDQASLSLALSARPVPFRELPLAMNFPLHLTHLDPTPDMQSCDPVILHYHDRVDANGYLQPSPYPGAQKRIDQFNQRLRKERRQRFENRLFWDFRYTRAPELGSGLGSRGLATTYKQEVLRRLVALHQPQSILDVGCGDQAVSQALPDNRYIGVDVSSVIIDRCRADYPNRRFICGDVLDLDLPPADLLLCLDMLIHIDDMDRYRASVEHLVALTNKVGLASGYETPPDTEHDITFWHEPLSQTLRRAGACQLRQVGAYRDVVLWMYEPPDSESHPPISGRSRARALQKPVFIVGCMRSGTTLLASLLDEVKSVVHCPFELKHVWSEVGQVPMASPRTRDTICPQLGEADVVDGQAERLIRAFLTEMEKKQAGKQDNSVFLTKNPHLCNKLPFVRSLFPDARFVWIYRHLPYVVASLKVLFEDVQRRQQTWHYWPEPRPDVTARCWEAFHFELPEDNVDPSRCFPGGDVKFLAEYWLESNQAVAIFFQTLSADQALTIREEQLIESPEVQLARCEAFLDLQLSSTLPADVTLDSTRNRLWESRLTLAERLTLLEFVLTNGQFITELFTDVDCAALYRDQLKSSLIGSFSSQPAPSESLVALAQESENHLTQVAALVQERDTYHSQLLAIQHSRAWRVVSKIWWLTGSLRKLKDWFVGLVSVGNC